MTRTTEEFEEHILDVDVIEEMESSFLEYAYSAIYVRVLPDARDGLKPVRRRTLFSMDDIGIGLEKGHVEYARVVGRVMGVLHPHGDSTIYNVLVRMTQPWATRLPLVDGHGNFGSLGAGPAAMRYTEYRMAHPAVTMITGLDEDVVDFRSNYDGKDTEPEVLPAALPNLLINGASRITVGMVTSIAPHNLREMVSVLRALLRNREVSLEELMRHLPEPDFPSEGQVVGFEGIRGAYAAGRGSFKVRARTSIKRVSTHRRDIVITELPYLVDPERIIEQIKKGISSHKLVGIIGVKDLTDLANDTGLAVEIKNGINPETLPGQFYRVTKLEDTFAINTVAFAKGQSRALTLKQLLEAYLDHRLQVTIRRTRHCPGKARERLHLVRGLLLAIVDIDEAIVIVRSSENTAETRTRLIGTLDLGEVRVNHILDIQLHRLTKYSTLELSAKADELATHIDKLQRILDDDTVLNALVSSGLDEVAEWSGTPHRTVLLAAGGVVRSATPLEVPDKPCWMLLSTTEHATCTDSAAPLPMTGPRAAHDVIVTAIRVTSRAGFRVITNTGRLLWARTIGLPTMLLTVTAPNLRGGSESRELRPLEREERVVDPTSLDPEGPGLALGALRGVVKRVNPEVIGKGSWDVIRLEKDDEVVGMVELESPNLTFITSDAQLLHFSAGLVRPQGRLDGGVAGVRLSRDAKMLFFGGMDPTTDLMVATAGTPDSLFRHTATGAKVTPLIEYPTKGRVAGGVKCQRFLKGETALITATIGGFVTAVTSDGAPVVPSEPTPKRDGSGVSLKGMVEALGAWHTPEVVESIP